MKKVLGTYSEKTIYNRLAKAFLVLSFLTFAGFQELIAQPTADVISSGFVAAGTTLNTLTVQHTPGVNANRLMMVAISTQQQDITSVQYEGVDLEPVPNGAIINSTRARIYFYYLVNPVNPVTPPGNVTVTLDASTNRGIIMGVITFSGVDQNNPLNTFSGTTGSGTPITLNNIATAINQTVFSAYTVRDSDPSSNAGLAWNIYTGTLDQNDNIAGAGSTKTGDGVTTSVSYTVPTAREWSLGAVSIVPVVYADLGVSKTVDIDAPYAGETITFTITAINNSLTSNAPNVLVNDILPDGYIYGSHSTASGTYNGGSGEWAVGTLTAGSSAILTIEATVLGSGNYVNTATISGDVIDNTPGNNASSAYVTICQAGGTQPLFGN